jgi:hypothetical protein
MMRRILSQAVLAGLLIGGGLLGCTKPMVKEKPVPDPLLTSKKPIEGRSLSSESPPPPSEDLLPPLPPAGTDFSVPRGSDGTIVRMLSVRAVGQQ